MFLKISFIFVLMETKKNIILAEIASSILFKSSVSLIYANSFLKAVNINVISLVETKTGAFSKGFTFKTVLTGFPLVNSV